ncbi:MAG TPA: hypothetical protein VFF13_06470 [archaeon]|nr:hypothetical protein [archaeon]
MSAPSNAHVAISTSEYANKVGCTADTSAPACSDPSSAIALKLSSATNAHAESPNLSNYTQNICIKASATNQQTYCYALNDCPSDFIGLVNLYGETGLVNGQLTVTNALVGAYAAGAPHICCGLRDLDDSPATSCTITASPTTIEIGETSSIAVTCSNALGTTQCPSDLQIVSTAPAIATYDSTTTQLTGVSAGDTTARATSVSIPAVTCVSGTVTVTDTINNCVIDAQATEACICGTETANPGQFCCATGVSDTACTTPTPNCVEGENTTGEICSCNGTPVPDGEYCCSGVASTVSCDQLCPQGQITTTCSCENQIRNSGDGYCCSGVFQTTQCTNSSLNHVKISALRLEQTEFFKDSEDPITFAIDVERIDDSVTTGYLEAYLIHNINQTQTQIFADPTNELEVSFVDAEPMTIPVSFPTTSLATGSYRLVVHITSEFDRDGAGNIANDEGKVDDNTKSASILVRSGPAGGPVAAPEIHPIFIVFILFAVLMIIKRN